MRHILSTARPARTAGAGMLALGTGSRDVVPTLESLVPNQSEEQTESGSSGGAGDDNPDTDTQESGVEPLPIDKVFEILKNNRRRQALRYLNENGGNTSLSELAEHIAALENDCSIRAISSSQRKRVYVGLYQCHLPKMDDMHIVDFEKNRGTVELAANASQLEPYLGETESFAWSRLYFAVTVVAIGTLAVSLLGSAPFGLTPLVVLVTLLAVMAISSITHAYYRRIQE